jgi:hypothetical protein
MMSKDRLGLPHSKPGSAQPLFLQVLFPDLAEGPDTFQLRTIRSMQLRGIV